MGKSNEGLNFKSNPPISILMVGLQGSGKTTSSAKLANWIIKHDKKKVMMASLDIYRPAAQEQLITLGNNNDIPTLELQKNKSPLEISKLAIQEAKTSGVEVLILRLPLVCGEEAPGNLGLLKKITNWQIPLPFKDVGNRRSIISVETLANVVTDCALDKVKWEGIELITDPQPLSTESIILKFSQDWGRSVLLFSVPKKIMKLIFVIVGKRTIYEKLFEDLVFESSRSVSSFIEKGLK